MHGTSSLTDAEKLMLATWLLTGLLTTTASAADCDIKALRAELTEASPVSVPGVYTRLVACDPTWGKKLANDALGRTLAGEEGDKAAYAALAVGANDQVRGWIASLEPDQRSSTVIRFGGRCQEDPKVEAFFIESHKALGRRFFRERWHRGLTDCRTEGIRALLTTAIDGDPTDTRSQYFDLVQVYARNLGGEAIPKLVALVDTAKMDDEFTTLVEAFADAANVGSVQGTNPDAAAKAVVEIEKLGPRLPERAVDQARNTLQALGAQEVADRFVRYRWPKRFENDLYRYAAMLTVEGTCKNGKKVGGLHGGAVAEGGMHWPDQLVTTAPEQLAKAWDVMAIVDKCKGKGSYTFELSKEPLPDADAATAWIEERRKAFLTGPALGLWKSEAPEHEPVKLP